MDTIRNDQIVRAYLTKDRPSLFRILPDSTNQDINRQRYAIHAVLERTGLIKPFLYHPFKHGELLPFYHNIVQEPMWMERIIYRFECLKTNTLKEDFALMLSNALSYEKATRNTCTIKGACKELWRTFNQALLLLLLLPKEEQSYKMNY